MSESQTVEYAFEHEKTLPCRVKSGYGEEAGKTGQYFGSVVVDGVTWAVVVWDDEEDPDFFKQAGLETSQLIWRDMKHV